MSLTYIVTQHSSGSSDLSLSKIPVDTIDCGCSSPVHHCDVLQIDSEHILSTRLQRAALWCLFKSSSKNEVWYCLWPELNF